MAVGSARGVAPEHRLGRAGPLRRLPAAPSTSALPRARPGRRSVPRHPPRRRQPSTRPAAESRTTRSGHRGRKDDPLYRIRRLLLAAHERLDDAAATPNSAACSQPATPAARSAWRGTPRKPSAASTTSTARSSPTPTSQNSPRTYTDADCPPELRRLGRTLGRWHHPDRELAPRPRLERPHRSDQQPHQTRQTRRLRIPPLRALPDPGAALRRQTQLDTPRQRHSPLKTEAPVFRGGKGAGCAVGAGVARRVGHRSRHGPQGR